MRCDRIQARRAALGLALVVASPITELTAHAELDLQWNAPAGCPDRDDVQNRLRALAGLLPDQAQGLSVEGRIERVNGRFSLTLLVRDGIEIRKRVITSDSCPSLAGAAAVSVALLLGVDVQAVEPIPARAESNGQEGPPPGALSDRSAERGPPPVEPSVPNTSTADRAWSVVVRAPVVVAELGPLPRPSVGAGGGAGMRYGSWWVMLGGTYFGGQTVSVSDLGATVGAELKRVTGHLALCRGWRARSLEIAPCVEVALEYITARGSGEGVTPSTRRAVWPAPGAGAAVHWYALRSLAVFAGFSGRLEMSSPRLVIDGLGEVAQLGWAAVRSELGLNWVF